MRKQVQHHIEKALSHNENTSWPWLRIFAVSTGGLHFVQAILATGLYAGTRPAVTVHVTANYALWLKGSAPATLNCAASDGGTQYCGADAGTINMMGLVIAFFALSAAFQLIPALFFWSVVKGWLSVGVQPARWVEYAASASCLLLVAFLLDGVTDVHLLALAFAANATIMLLGYLQELVMHILRLVKEQNSIMGPYVVVYASAHVLGWLLYLALWVILFHKFQLSYTHSGDNPDMNRVPAIVQAVYPVLFILYTGFAIVQMVQMGRLYKLCIVDMKGEVTVTEVKKYVKKVSTQAEWAYTALSFVTKTLLAWMFYGGVNSYSNRG